MARKPRVHLPGGLYHVILRGNGGQDIFLEDEDRYRLYLLLQEGTERYGHRIHAFCLMTNHIHLALQVRKVPLSKIIQNLSFRYTRWFNGRRGRVGHLFQGRYKALLVDAETYLLALVRYIHLNPSRAKLVDQPQQYPWSGHRAYLGEAALPWLTTDWVLGRFSKGLAVARRRYALFVQHGRGEGHREEFHRGSQDVRVLGDDSFVEQVLDNTRDRRPKPPTLKQLIERVGDRYGLTYRQMREPGQIPRIAEARGVVGWLASESGSINLKGVAEAFRRDATTLSVAVRRVMERARCSETFERNLWQLLDGSEE